jgi:GNAT superfamily N-acetyltransferase
MDAFFISKRRSDYDGLLCGTIFIYKSILPEFEKRDFKPITWGSFYEDDKSMDLHYLIATGNVLKQENHKGMWFAPQGTYVHKDFRGRGLGKLLYKSILMAIQYESLNLKKMPKLCTHNGIEYSVGRTSDLAMRVYKSLEYEGIIRQIDFDKENYSFYYNILKYPGGFEIGPTQNIDNWCNYSATEIIIK